MRGCDAVYDMTHVGKSHNVGFLTRLFKPHSVLWSVQTVTVTATATVALESDLFGLLRAARDRIMTIHEFHYNAMNVIKMVAYNHMHTKA